MLYFRFPLFLSLFLIITLFACKDTKESKSIQSYENKLKSSEYFKYTKLIKLQQYKGYQILTLMNPWNPELEWITYLLIEENYQQPQLNIKPNFTVQLPLTRTVVTMASGLGFIDQLQSLECIVGVSKKEFVYNPLIRKSIDDGLISQVGSFEQQSIENLLMTKPQLLIQSAYSADQLSMDKFIINAGIPVIYNCDWIEENPLARAEWIKFFGLLLSKATQAEAIFDSIEVNYHKQCRIAESKNHRITVLVGTPYKDIWYLPAGGSYKAQMIKDAGGYYAWKDHYQSGSLALSFEEVYAKQHQAEVWIEVPFETFNLMQSENSNYELFDSFKNKRVYNNRKQMHADGANNYWERGVCRPDEILADYIKIFNDGSDIDSLLYYKRLK